ncbi:MAG: alpha/beta hydrolase family protein [Deferribacterales bacterium]
MLFRIPLLLLLLVLPAEVFAGAGYAEQVFKDKQRHRKLDTFIWYPSAEAEVKESEAKRVFKGFYAEKNSKITAVNAPLVVMLHGTGGNKTNQGWLAQALAENGAVVIAADHPKSSVKEAGAMPEIWLQAQDASFLIDSILLSEYSQYIDSNKIYALGFSLGGYSALALAGAEVNMRRYIDFCSEESTKACANMAPILKKMPDTYFETASKSYADRRIKKVTAIAPAFVGTMSNESLASINIPVMVLAAGQDLNIDPDLEYEQIYDGQYPNIAYDEVYEADHYAFIQECKDGAVEKMGRMAFLCREPVKQSRAESHKEALSKIIPFIFK